ncbi:UNC93-like protein MFSD11 isoform X2 [Procambarus clarkii]|uniref:UNC93-like protein MFSD11 isoform X2 n=1 Tax=Procambarus clarkii TaxID=6728 RepID=UPI001E671003|nr:UNC93-like protein MFSD11 isoform X2 [Procambarus clarkii]XP_045595132.1 UNC93-like protein MFSD11 isoform X2 [Procambarus clarkii]XP_045595133.1 UNC93-like protein MFSD11 isoform X2 [Procambarus clarkii]XP_045595134.1 UNC93-like protein MFSD11 isoform X2 [Procambarus clarkii]XP_045595135.1 UNC93-like protein MFSD11 isoform X2 [Procambarus clarkii]XP_045595136.1 UNC93-like protein MFSD11 isoform X2 [Procambarus clarkii]XP_045595137.1 UNC93-like protein MFSD11 isoform X2 [Procambarus clarki
MKVPIDQATINVGILGLAYMFVFTSFQTQGNMQQVVIKSIKSENPNFEGSGYTSLAIIYAVFAFFNWLSPSCLSYLGPKLTMIIGGITYAIFIAGFLWPQTVILYLTSVLVGAGAALIWTGQGNYLTLMSTQKTMSRNSGIFWAMLQSSMLFGNLFVFYQFMGKTIIDQHTRTIVFSALTVVGLIGIGIMCTLPKPGADGSGRSDDSLGSPFDALKKSFSLFRTKDMLLLSATFFYTGIELSFFSGVYSACLSSTLRFPDPKRLVGLSGMFIGIGEILGGGVFGIFGSKTVKYGRDPIVLLGYLVHMLCFFLIFLNLPTISPLSNTTDPSFLSQGQPSQVIAMLCSFMLGFGDACFNTQIYSILGTVYQDNSGPAFALFKFTQSLSAAACFFYSSVFELYWHLAILVVFATIGTLTFCSVEWRAHRRLRAKPDTAAFD